MPSYLSADAELYYEDDGAGFPILFIAPGGMRSAIPLWANAPWHPIDALRDSYRTIAMDQRNAGQSRGAVAADHGWHTYRDDQLALLDHLGVERCHLVGMCIGGSYGLNLLAHAPERFASAVLFQPIGLDGNRDVFHELFDGWAETLEDEHDAVSPSAWTQFRSNLFDGDFVFSVSRETVAGINVPLLIPCGEDVYHPRSTSLEIVAQAPRATLLEPWKTPDAVPSARQTVTDFLARHTPA
ncbi:MAG: alpha/beta hydrolase [Pseudomonadota bacterium]